MATLQVTALVLLTVLIVSMVTRASVSICSSNIGINTVTFYSGSNLHILRHYILMYILTDYHKLLEDYTATYSLHS